MADDDTYARFREAVNMTPHQLEQWLETEESRSVGIAGGEKKSAPGGKESTGHESGRRIVEILRKGRSDLDADDEEQMGRVVAYVHRHLAQRPTKEDVEGSRWRASLMNWGHDPLKD
ncbi:uncharacterized protein DUF3140 [Motilibacter rhizosphaerae]|uniref:Uncharacterized protein DUF3140 n=1 Tax=Motilibacter rhizosphaerae TaxID=598652 RepID=A0A4Q7NPW9_9ACTN|nr:DUF3140 domain-containing protein [Motilibacter rhizosphaerae]RZS87329.1 uncharacterized protein DUF3140 [Motilibacter rhizosphaerae]